MSAAIPESPATSLAIPPLLTGKCALVTGAGQGIGRAIAQTLHAAGAEVVCTDIDRATVEAVAKQLTGRGRRAWGLRLDVSDAQDCARVRVEVEAACGGIHVLVNNAGILVRKKFDEDPTGEVWDRVIDVNLSGTANVIGAFLPQLRARRGAIVNLASTNAFVDPIGNVGYAASKGGVKMLTQALARDLAPDGIRVNAVAPGIMYTEMNRPTIDAPDTPTRLARFPIARFGLPLEVALPVLFLCSELASYTTGATLAIDGGRLATS